MHVTDYIKNRNNKTLISIEIIPPKKGKSWQELKKEVETLQGFGLTWVSVTSHAHEREIQEVNDQQIFRTKRKRLDTNAICLALHGELGTEVMPHIVCQGFTKDETEDALVNLNFFGVNNILALRGDSLPNQFPVEKNYPHNDYAVDLVKQIVQMNNGIYLDDTQNNIKTNFCIGVAGYPEKHFEAPDLSTDLQHLKAKVDAGANFVITQMFFNNEAYYRFVEDAASLGIKAPIIPGIKPIFKKRHLLLADSFHVEIPQVLRDSLEKYTKDEDIEKAGLEWSVKQCQDLIARDVPLLHLYTMGSAYPTTKLLKAIK